MTYVAVHAVPQQPPSVQLKATCPHAFLIGPLGSATRWFRERGYTLPILSQDRDFDERWSVEAQDREFAEALVRQREVRAALTSLHGLQCVSLSHSRRKLTAVLSGLPKDKAEREVHQQAVRAQLSAVDAVITRLCRQRSYPHHGCRAAFGVAALSLCLALASGLVGLVLGADELIDGGLGRLALRSLLVSVPLLLAVILVMARLLAGRSTSHKELGLIVLLAVLGLPALGVGGAVTVNRAFDSAPPVVHRVPVLELREKRGDGKQIKHYAVVPAWQPDHAPTLSLKLGKSVAAQAVAGTSWLSLTTSPGRLGVERLLDLRIEDGSGLAR